MRKIISAAFVSLDGVMQAPGGPTEDPTGGFRFGGWVEPHFDEAGGQEIGKMFSQPFDLLLGRRTYDIFAAYWPYQDDDIGKAFGACAKYVVTREAKAAFDWDKTVVLRGEAAQTVAELKAGDGPDLLIQGSSEMTHALLAAGLIDRLQVMTFPLLLGKGKRLFDDSLKPMDLTLDHSVTTPSGVVITSWLPKGAVTTGSFAGDDPSPAELARREAMARGDW